MKLLDGIPCGDSFPTCKFIADAVKAQERTSDLKERMANLKMVSENITAKISTLNIDEIEEKIASYYSIVSRKENLQTEIERDELQVENNKKQIKITNNDLESLFSTQTIYEENKEAIENKEAYLIQRDHYVQKKQKLEQENEQCKVCLQEFFIEKGSTQQAIDGYIERKAELEDKEKEFIAQDLFLECMHANGIAYNVIRQMLPVINEEIAKVLTNIVDFEVFFENDGRRLNVYIKHPRHDPRPIELGSGAEKTIASMAIRLALLHVSSLPSPSVFILDEPGTALDAENLEGFVRILEMVKSYFKTVILISHLDSLKDCVDHVISIEKENGFAKVVV